MVAVSAAVAALCGLAVAIGVWLLVQTVANNIVVGARSASARGRSDRRPARQPIDRRTLLYATAGAAIAVAILATTQLVVAAVAAGLATILIPRVLQARADRDRAISKMRAAAEFVEAIRGSLGAGSGLEAAIIESALRPPEALDAELTAFADYARLPEVTTEQALRHLADEAREPAIDLLVGSLLAALKGAAGEMGQLFERIADQGRSFAETRAVTQSERSKVEFQTKILSLLVIAVALLSVVVSPDLTSAYDATALGQFRLAIPALIFAFGWWWLTRMNRVESAYRFQLRTVDPA
ncbi:MAG: type II secretion system F family protein [Acidimicrobiales bacterium]